MIKSKRNLNFNIKFYIIVLMFLYSCKESRIQVYRNNSNSIYLDKYIFLINDSIKSVNEIDKNQVQYKLDTLLITDNVLGEKNKYLPLTFIDKGFHNYSDIYVSFKQPIDSGKKIFDYDIRIFKDDSIYIKLYDYGMPKEIHLKLEKNLIKWLKLILSEFENYKLYYGNREYKYDKPEIVIICYDKTNEKSKLVYGDLSLMPERMICFHFLIELIINENYYNAKSVITKSYPSADSLNIHSQKSGIGTGRIPEPIEYE